MSFEKRLRFYALCAILLNAIHKADLSGRRIPIGVWQNVLDMNATEFIGQLIRDGNATENTDLWDGDESASSDPDPNAVDSVVKTIAQPADPCQPIAVAVKIPTGNDPNVLLYPECTAIRRCGGCCGHDMLECTKAKANMLAVKVVKSRYDHALERFLYIGMVDVLVEQHLSCACQCKIRAEHCNPYIHEYMPDACRCRCYNEKQASSCPSDRRWDDQECDCVCPKVHQCHDDERFSHRECRCELDQGTPRPVHDVGVGNDPCGDVLCRAGYEAVPEDGECMCYTSDYWGVEAASADNNGYDPNDVPAVGEGEEQVPEEDQTTPTTTTTTTTTRRPSRPRPSTRRNIAARRPRPRDRDRDANA